MSYGLNEDYGEVEPAPSGRRGFAKLDLVDVILSEDPFEQQKPPIKHGINFLEKLGSTVLGKKGGLLNTKQDEAPIPLYQPTYRLEPKKKFDPDRVYKIIKTHLDKELKDMVYGEKECQTACKRISYYIRKSVKQLNYDRYRIICQVRIIEKQSQGMESRTGFLLDPNYDACVSYAMDTQSFAASAVVYGIYKD